MKTRCLIFFVLENVMIVTQNLEFLPFSGWGKGSIKAFSVENMMKIHYLIFFVLENVMIMAQNLFCCQ